MSTLRSLWRWRIEPLRPVRSFRERVERDARQDAPKYAWLATLLQNHPNLFPVDKKTEMSVFDVNSDGRVLDPKFGPSLIPGYASTWLESNRETDDCVRIIYVGMEKEDIFNAAIVDVVAMKYNLAPAFFFDHFLPSLWSDKRISFNNQPLSWVPPTPSEHEYLRMKDSEGRNISAAFTCKDDTGVEKTIIILGPLKTKVQPEEDYKFQLSNFGKRREGTPAPTMYNGSEYSYPIIQLLNKEYSQFLQNLKLKELDESNIVAHRRLVVATDERLRYCLYNVSALGDGRNPETQEIVDHYHHLIKLAKQP